MKPLHYLAALAAVLIITIHSTAQSSAATQNREEIAFGNDPLQKLDFYRAETEGPAPLILFVHGGAWRRGDKISAVGDFKASHYNRLGYHFASTNYRLVPDAKVEQQAEDVAASLAELLERSEQLDIDRSRVVLMGHSAGAHLVVLVGTDPQYLKGEGLSFTDIDGVIPLDGAAYDIPTQMAGRAPFMRKTYEQAFGTELARQQRLSPAFHAAAPNVSDFLILHVERRSAGQQARELAAKLHQAGTNASVEKLEGRGMQGHREINRRMGDPDYVGTEIVDKWLAHIFR